MNNIPHIPNVPNENSRPDSERPKFHIGEDGVIHFDKPAAPPPPVSAPGPVYAPPQRKKGKGCLVKALIAVGVLAFIGVVAAVAVFIFMGGCARGVVNDVCYDGDNPVQVAVSGEGVYAVETPVEAAAAEAAKEEWVPDLTDSYSYDPDYPMSVYGVNIYHVDFGNNDYYGNVIDECGRALYSDRMRYFVPRICYSASQSTCVTMSYILKFPDGHTEHSNGKDVSLAANDDGCVIRLEGWGNNDASNYPTGDYTFHLVMDSYIVYRTGFTIY